MNVERVRDVDALFFFQLLLPFYDPENLGSMAILEYLTIQTSRSIVMPLRHSVDKVQVMDIVGNLHLPESF